MPAIAVFFRLVDFLNFTGIRSNISFQSFSLLILFFKISMPSSVVQTGSLGILIDKKFFSSHDLNKISIIRIKTLNNLI